jgi:PAS domain S-box-containing protein
MGRQSLPRLDRLTVRLVLGITLLISLPVAAGMYLLAKSHFTHTLAARQTAAQLQNRILEAALRHEMLDEDSGLIAEILEEVGLQPEVRSAMILDREGFVRLSSHEQEVGVRLSLASPTCAVCHTTTPDARDRSVVLESEDDDILRSVHPIANRPECHSCHDASQAFNGILILDISLAGTQQHLRRDAIWMTAVATLLMFTLLSGVGLLLRRLVLVRLERLCRTARSIAAGALGERATVEGDDVVASLAQDLNSMADATCSLIDSLKQREEQMSGVLNSLDDGLIVLDRSFRVVAANRSIARRLCSYPEALQGHKCRDATGHSLPCDRDTECPTARCLHTGQVQRAVYHLPDSGTGDGQVHEVYASPIYSQDGSVAQVVEVWRDITERVREEEHLAEIERLSSLGILASGLSHEVNSPLASTLTCADSILGRLKETSTENLSPETLDAIQDSATIIREQVLHCRKITERFLRFARGIPPSIEPLDLQEVVRSVMSLAEPTARGLGIQLKFRNHMPLPLVTANTEVVQHVVLNVLVNAIEAHGHKGGAIHAQFLLDSSIRLQIRDSGCGIPAEFQEHLFEPFRTQKSRGTGLGLFLSRTFMRRFGGDVRLVDSVVGQGSCVEIVFPLSEREVA